MGIVDSGASLRISTNIVSVHPLRPYLVIRLILNFPL